MTIISHTHKFVYFKPRKVAGSSLLVAFGQHCAQPDIVTAPGNTEGFLRNAMNDTGLATHTYPADIKSIMQAADWCSYFKVTCVRNPWDAAVSMLFWRISRRNRKGLRFSPAVEREILDGTIDVRIPEYREQMTLIIGRVSQNIPFYFDEEGRPWADHYIRYEALQSGFDEACDRIGLPRSTLPRLKSYSRDHALGYRRFFDDELREAMHASTAPIIEHFNYRF